MNDISCLKDGFRQDVEKLIERCKDISEFRITETCRTLERQKELYAQGFSKTLQSKHLTGEAVDIYVKDYSWDLYKQIHDQLYDLKIIWPFEDLGWDWDKPHFQYAPDKKVEESKMLSEEEVREGVKAVIHDFLGYEPTDDQVNGHIAAMKERQKTGKYALSEFVHDRFKEMPKPNCTAQVNLAITAYKKRIIDLINKP